MHRKIEESALLSKLLERCRNVLDLLRVSATGTMMWVRDDPEALMVK
jgi:hypothetical protein